jgi:hypothetical protein
MFVMRFSMIIRDTPNSTPTFIRLRRALKMLLRAYGFRCDYINEIKGGDATGSIESDANGSDGVTGGGKRAEGK